MNETIRALQPKSVWNKFADLNAVPRPSKKEEKVIQFMMDFGEMDEDMLEEILEDADERERVFFSQPEIKKRLKENKEKQQTYISIAYEILLKVVYYR